MRGRGPRCVVSTLLFVLFRRIVRLVKPDSVASTSADKERGARTGSGAHRLCQKSAPSSPVTRFPRPAGPVVCILMSPTPPGQLVFPQLTPPPTVSQSERRKSQPLDRSGGRGRLTYIFVNLSLVLADPGPQTVFSRFRNAHRRFSSDTGLERPVWEFQIRPMKSPSSWSVAHLLLYVYMYIV